MDETGQGNSKRKYISWLWSTSWFLLLFDSFYWVSFHYNTRIPSEVSQLLIFFFEGLWYQSFRGWWTLWMPTDQMNIRKKNLNNVQYSSWMDGWKHSRHVYLRVYVCSPLLKTTHTHMTLAVLFINTISRCNCLLCITVYVCFRG